MPAQMYQVNRRSGIVSVQMYQVHQNHRCPNSQQILQSAWSDLKQQQNIRVIRQHQQNSIRTSGVFRYSVKLWVS